MHESWERDHNDESSEEYDSFFHLAPCTVLSYWRICQIHQSWEHGLGQNDMNYVFFGYLFILLLT